MSQLFLTRTIFHHFFLARVFGNFHFIPRCLQLFPFDLLALNLKFEPDTRGELFLTWCRDPGCERSPSEQGFHSISLRSDNSPAEESSGPIGRIKYIKLWNGKEK